MNVNYLVLLSVLVLSVSIPNVFADTIYLKINRVDGESTDSAHQDWIDVTSWSWGSTSSGDTSDQRDTNQVSISDLTITKQVDKSSPLLFLASASGEHFSQVVFEVVSTSSKGAYLIYSLDDVFLTGYSISESSGDAIPTETISLSFSRILVTDSASGNEVNWDLTKMMAVHLNL